MVRLVPVRPHAARPTYAQLISCQIGRPLCGTAKLVRAARLISCQIG
jgi:hypothetical protein